MTNPGTKSLRKLQFGRETTSGTLAAATTIWRGEKAVIEDALLVVHPTEDIGYISELDRTYIPKKEAKITIGDAEATYEQLCHLLEMGVKTATPVQDGTGSAYVRTYAFPVTSQNTIKTYSIEGGDDITAGQEVVTYCHVTDFKLTFEAEKAMMVSATIKGQQVTLQNFSGGATLPAVEEILASKGKLYIDAVGGTLGGTLKSGILRKGSMTVKTGLLAYYTMDGSLYFSAVKGTAPEIVLELTYEHEGNSETEKIAWRAQTARKMRLLFLGNSLTTSGTTGGYTSKQVMIDVAGKYEKFAALSDENGNDQVVATFRVRYDATAALFCNITVVNELATLP